MSKPIRVLQVFHGMDCGGAENMIMNLYRNIDRSKVQFDFLVHTKKKCFFDDEIKNLGGRIFRVPYYNIKNTIAYKKALCHLYESHPEFRIVHGHLLRYFNPIGAHESGLIGENPNGIVLSSLLMQN